MFAQLAFGSGRDGDPGGIETGAHLCYTAYMPAKNPRLSVVLERPLYDALRRLARREGISLSLKARDLLRDALETYEDLELHRIAEERERTFDASRALSHAEVWQPARTRKAP